MIVWAWLSEVVFELVIETLLDEPVGDLWEDGDLHGYSLDATRFRVSRRGKVVKVILGTASLTGLPLRRTGIWIPARTRVKIRGTWDCLE